VIVDCAMSMLATVTGPPAGLTTLQEAFTVADRCGCPTAGPRAAQALAAVVDGLIGWETPRTGQEITQIVARATEWLRCSIESGHAAHITNHITNQGAHIMATAEYQTSGATR
jgi:hypothetical protein